MKILDNIIGNFFGIRDIRLFINYLIIAAFATIVDVGIFYYMTEFLNVWYIYSAVFGYAVGMVTHYSLNKYLNFKNKSKRIILQFGLFATVALIGLCINQIILYFLVEFLSLWYMYAKVISIMIVAIWNFYGHKNLTFNIFK